MTRAFKSLLVLAFVALLGAGLAACGGGGDSTSSVTSASTAPSGGGSAGGGGGEGAKPAKATGGKPSGGGGSGQGSARSGSGGSSGGGSAQFETKGGDNSIQGFGSEGGGSQLEGAATALHGYLDARAAGEWAKACTYMASGVAKSLQQFAPASPQGKGKSAGCPQLLAALSAGMPASLRHELAQADPGALRIEGDHAFLLYHGAHGTDYFMPMAHEGGGWKVAAIAASALS